MSKIIKNFALYLGLACVLVTSIQAETTNEGDRVEARARAMTKTERIEWREAVAKQIQEEKEISEEETTTEVDSEKEENFELKSIVQPEEKSSYLRGYDNAMHWATACSFDGSIVEIEDGSQFSVSYFDSWKTIGWLSSDVLVITPNSSLFSLYDYEIHNLTTWEVVECDLFAGPYLYSPYRLWIAGIDYLMDEVLLCDGTLWDISILDWNVLSSWYVGDSIIIGVNDSFINPYILINVETDNYATASLY